MASVAAAQQCSLHAVAQCQNSRRQVNVRASAFVNAPLRATRPQHNRASATSGSKRGLVVVAAAATEPLGKLISKVEIPAFIPRQDLIDQLSRWAMIEVQENGVANCGTPCRVTSFSKEGYGLWGFTVSFLKDGVSAADVRVSYDEEVTHKHEWVGRAADGFPMLEGNAEEILGKNFEIRKICDRQINDAQRQSIREFCTMLVEAINRYYAFGSCFVDDAT